MVLSKLTEGLTHRLRVKLGINLIPRLTHKLSVNGCAKIAQGLTDTAWIFQMHKGRNFSLLVRSAGAFSFPPSEGFFLRGPLSPFSESLPRACESLLSRVCESLPSEVLDCASPALPLSVMRFSSWSDWRSFRFPERMVMSPSDSRMGNIRFAVFVEHPACLAMRAAPARKDFFSSGGASECMRRIDR